MLGAPISDYLRGFVQGKSLLVNALTDERIKHISECHHPRGERDLLFSEPVRISRTIPFFMVPLRNLDRRIEKTVVSVFCVRLADGSANGLSAKARVRLHRLPFCCVQFPGLEQYPVRDSDLADVMQRRRQRDIANTVLGKKLRIAPARSEFVAQQVHITLGAQNMRASLVVTRRCQTRQRAEGNILYTLGLLQPSMNLGFQRLILFGNLIADTLEVQMGPHPGVKDRGVYRLGDVIDRAQLESGFLITHRVERGDKNNGNIAGSWIVIQPLDDFVAINIGHHDIQQNQVGGWISRSGC